MLIKRCLCLISLLINISFISCQNYESIHQVVPKKNNDIASITLYSYYGKSESKYFIPSYGHTFLEITNLSNEEIILYYQIIQPQESIVFSWWAIDVHMGIWFNIEPYYIYYYNRYDTRYSTTIYMNHDDLDMVNIYLQTNDKYDPLNNCSKMALKCWNLVAEKSEKIDILFLTTPTYVVRNIKTFDSFSYIKSLNNKGSIGFVDNQVFNEYKMEIK